MPTPVPASVWLKTPSGLVDYRECWQAMQDFTAARTEHSPDQIWVLQHPSVFTLGHAGRPEHLLAPGSTPVIHVDRGGQITWHGPGQCVVYLMLDLRRLGYGVRELVGRMERAVIATLSGYEIEARARADAPGVYVEGAKIASLGLKVKRGRSYHGLALNVDCSLDDFARINPCGYSGLAVTRMQDVLGQRCPAIETVGAELVSQLGIALGFAQESIQPMEWQHG